MFNLYSRMLDYVPRWTVAPIADKQSVASHSFYVALYTMELCRWLKLDAWHTKAAIQYALVHDMAEARTGDFPGPVKREVVNMGALDAYEDSIVRKMGLSDPENIYYLDKVKSLVKVADMIEEVFYVSLQVASGNDLMRNQLKKSRERAHEKMLECELLGSGKCIELHSILWDESNKILAGDLWLPHSDGDPFFPPTPEPAPASSSSDDLPF